MLVICSAIYLLTVGKRAPLPAYEGPYSRDYAADAAAKEEALFPEDSVENKGETPAEPHAGQETEESVNEEEGNEK